MTPLINAATNGQKSAVMALLVLGAALEGWEEVHARIAAAEGEAELGASDDGD